MSRPTTAAPGRDLKNSRIGAYEIRGRLGAGGMGEVYRAKDTRLDRVVALKILPEAVASDPDRVRRFEKEARSASALNHPNIVTVYEVGFAESISYIALELVEGKTLRELLFSGAISVKRLLEISCQIASGLAEAHRAGIIHRDLKPENIMVTKDGLVKILDFGLAKRLPFEGGAAPLEETMTAVTEAGLIIGTVGYMSPEQAEGQPVDFRSDQFSVGSILYEMATSKRAFSRPTTAQTLAAIIQDEPEPIVKMNPAVPAPLRWIIDRCLAKEPRERYAATDDVARDLATLRDHLSEASLSAAVSPVPSAKGIRVRGVALASALAAALAAGVFVGRPVWKARFDTHPTLRQVTFRHTGISDARFGPDGQTIIFSIATVGGQPELQSAQPGNPESKSLGLPPADILSVSPSGELAILFGGSSRGGTLARVSLAGGAPRELMERVAGASWAPDGKALAVLHWVDGRFRIEYPPGKVLYQPSGEVSDIRFSAAGDRLLLKESGTLADLKSLIVLDLSGKSRKIASVPYEAIWSPRGDEVWFNEIGKDGMTSIYAVTLSGKRRFVGSFPGDFDLHDISRDGRVLLERESMEYEMIGRAAGQPAERNLSWLDGSVPVDLSADGSLLLFSEVAMGGGPVKAIYKRGADGSPAVRLGEGNALALSPDMKWALAAHDTSGLVLLPTGPGQSRELLLPGISLFGPLPGPLFVGQGAHFLPDGKRILIRAIDADQKIRLHVLDTETGKARAVTPEGVHAQAPFLLSPDGESVICYRSAVGYERYELAGGPARKLPGLSTIPENIALRWCADGRSIFVEEKDVGLLKVFRLDLATGRRTPWRDLAMTGLATPQMAIVMIPTPDGRSYVYGYHRYSADLFIAEGLR